MKRLILIPLVPTILTALVLTSCGYDPIPPRATSRVVTPVIDSTEVNYGDGVYGIPYTNAPNVLAAFRHRHPDLRVTAVYSAAEAGYGATAALMVVTEPK